MCEYANRKILKSFPRDLAIRLRVMDAIFNNRRPSNMLNEFALVKTTPFYCLPCVVELYPAMSKTISEWETTSDYEYMWMLESIFDFFREEVDIHERAETEAWNAYREALSKQLRYKAQMCTLCLGHGRGALLSSGETSRFVDDKFWAEAREEQQEWDRNFKLMKACLQSMEQWRVDKHFNKKWPRSLFANE